MVSILTIRGKQKFTHNGYLYVLDKHSKTDKTIVFWRCENKNTCKGRIHTKNGKVICEITQHNHSSSAVSVEVARVKTKLKQRAQQTLEATSTTLNQCLASVSLTVQGAVPRPDSLKRAIRRKRSNMFHASPNATKCVSSKIPSAKMQMRICGRQNVRRQHDEVSNKEIHLSGTVNRNISFLYWPSSL